MILKDYMFVVCSQQFLPPAKGKMNIDHAILQPVANHASYLSPAEFYASFKLHFGSYQFLLMVVPQLVNCCCMLVIEL